MDRTNGPLPRVIAARKSGAESFTSGGAALPFNLHDFWGWSNSDLLSNTARGVLAEYIVAHATGIPTNDVREDWAPVDLTTPDGVTLQVKSAAFIQAWWQHEPSRIQFSVRPTRAWDPETIRLGETPERVARVYVFALLHHLDQPTIDPLDLDQWSFYVLPVKVLDERRRSQHSITLPSLRRLAEPADFHGLAAAVSRAASGS